jgi:fatty acid desaturase
LLIANCTLAGRVILGPAIAIVTFWSGEWRKLLSDRQHRFIWCRHMLSVMVLLAWTVGVCGVPLVVYALLVVYPSIALTHLRSFAEHKADDHSQLRTNVVEAGPVWGLIFLNNNLHVAHHAHPHVPWHELPRLWRSMRRAPSGAGLIFSGGYWEVLRKYWIRPFITAEHPFSGAELQ